MSSDLSTYHAPYCQTGQDFATEMGKLTQRLEGQDAVLAVVAIEKLLTENGHLAQLDRQAVATWERKLEAAQLKQGRGTETFIKIDRLAPKVHNLGETRESLNVSSSSTKKSKNVAEMGIRTLTELIMKKGSLSDVAVLDFSGWEPMPPTPPKTKDKSAKPQESLQPLLTLLKQMFPKAKVVLPPVVFNTPEDAANARKVAKGQEGLVLGDFRGWTGKLDGNLWRGMMKSFPNMGIMVKASDLKSLMFFADIVYDDVLHLEIKGDTFTDDKNLRSFSIEQVLDATMSDEPKQGTFFNLKTLVIRDSTVAELPDKLPGSLKEIVFENCNNASFMKAGLEARGYKVTVR